MKATFVNKKRLTGKAFHVQGAGSFTITVPFQADFIEAKFMSGKASKNDELTWELLKVVDGWEFTCTYVCAHARDISYTVAKLPKSGELVSQS